MIANSENNYNNNLKALDMLKMKTTKAKAGFIILKLIFYIDII